MTERCALTDLLPDQCGCKNHRDVMPPVEPTRYDVSIYITSRYDSTCALNRSHQISVGDRIAKAEGVGWICVDCAQDLT